MSTDDLPADPDLRPVLQWLALAPGQPRLEEAVGLQGQLLNLRAMPVAPAHRRKLLDLLYNHTVKITQAQLPLLHQVTLPVSRRIRQLVRVTQDVLAILTQDYLNNLADLFDPLAKDEQGAHLSSLQHAMQCLSWHLLIGHLVASPPTPEIWYQLHSTFQTSRRLGLQKATPPGNGRRIDHIYLDSLLLAAAQPASFTSRELEFIEQFVGASSAAVELVEDSPPGGTGVFWVDPERDAPAQALSRRSPPPEARVLYFACDAVAQAAGEHLAALERGEHPQALGLPEFAGSAAGHGVLRRLVQLWGSPARRRFPRRHQSGRAALCAGLDRLCQLLEGKGEALGTSEWMITNESPDGYAMMHVAGNTDRLRIGDVVAIQRLREEGPPAAEWQVCIVRWALSENPEHVEIGLQVLAPKAVPARLALPGNRCGSEQTHALLLPEIPPLRPLEALVVPAGTLFDDPAQKLILLVEQGNLAVYELRATQLEQQTANIEVFTVEPDGSP